MPLNTVPLLLSATDAQHLHYLNMHTHLNSSSPEQRDYHSSDKWGIPTAPGPEGLGWDPPNLTTYHSSISQQYIAACLPPAAQYCISTACNHSWAANPSDMSLAVCRVCIGQAATVSYWAISTSSCCILHSCSVSLRLCTTHDPGSAGVDQMTPSCHVAWMMLTWVSS